MLNNKYHKYITNILYNIIIPIIISLVIIPIFLSYIGTKYIYNTNINNSTYVNNNISRFIFIYSIIVGQVTYSLLSSSPYKLVWLPILDSIFILDKIYSNIHNNINSNANIHNSNVYNILYCLIILVIINYITSIISFMLVSLDWCNYMVRIPISVEIALGIYTGITFTILPIIQLYDNNTYNNSNTYTNVLFADKLFNILLQCIITIVGIMLFIYYMHPFIISLYIVCNIILIHIIYKYTNVCKYIHMIYDSNIYNTNIINIMYNTIHSNVYDGNLLNIYNIVYNIHMIISIVVVNIIMYTLSLVSYMNRYDIHMDVNREYMAYGLSNMIGVCCTGGINYACSILINISNNTYNSSNSINNSNNINNSNKYYNILLGICSTTILFVYHHIANYINIYVSLFIMQFIGVLYLLEYIGMIRNVSYVDMVYVIILSCINYINGGIIIICIVVISVIYIIRYICNTNMYNIHDTTIIFPIVVDAFNIHNIIKDIKNINNNTIYIDLTYCKYIDISGNITLNRYISNNNINIKIIGNCINNYIKI